MFITCVFAFVGLRNASLQLGAYRIRHVCEHSQRNGSDEKKHKKSKEQEKKKKKKKIMWN